jgi:PEP-utilising enzyme, PEP-binding domain
MLRGLRTVTGVVGLLALNALITGCVIVHPQAARDAGPSDRPGGRAGAPPRDDVVRQIMIPLVGAVQEMQTVAEETSVVLAEEAAREGMELDTTVGTMIELPRAAPTAG